MIYVKKNAVLSRQLGGYIRASTANPTGWRPGTLHQVSLSGPPDWKTAVARQNAVRTIRLQQARAVDNVRLRKAMLTDAFARRDTGAVRGLSGLDLGTQMVPGAQYTFHFVYSKLGFAIGPQAAADAANKAGSNFKSSVAASESSGIRVTFTYGGGANYTLSQAANELQNAINVWSVVGFGNGLSFSSAEGGPAPLSSNSQSVYAVSPDGTIIQFSDGSLYDTSSQTTYNADGTVRSVGAPPPGSGGGGGAPFNLLNFVEGLGTGGAVAVGLGLLLLLRG